ncbi:hypothetical protein BHE97_08105 [Aeromicrobium sp. PE09-221]|uniref:hypothetical protein n=1 Tax=Aeromicrobium sp. PE09-221 TaxID=1898043 RepID=UPI000B63C592|nr:hypothetical protein [Aeromicrobium sp. PE09-221]OUZ10302.1 hypothetical protein BHE97_08105 [Aeromicrobium sp. PE09-221]
MLVGHFAAGFAGKAVDSRAPLWSYLSASQTLDLAWAPLIIAGVEVARVDADLPGSPIHLDYMPFTHSLPAAVLWTALVIGLARLFKLPWRPSIVLGAVVFSHWILDLIVHRPDLDLWFGGPRVGLGMWDIPVPAATLEIGLLGAAVIVWAVFRSRMGMSTRSAVGIFTLLIGIQLLSQLATPPENVKLLAATTLTLNLIVLAVGWWIDRPKARATAEQGTTG